MCFGGASSQEQSISQSQQQMMTTLQNNYGQQFKNQSAILSSLTNSANSILAAGPGQYGFTPQENAALRTQADSGTAAAYQSARQAAGEQMAAIGGGNTYLPSGTQSAINANIATQAASQQANQQLGITEAGYQQGLANYQNAQNVLSGVAQQENPLGYAGAATSASNSAFGSANTIQQQQNAKMQSIMGLVGGIAGGVLSGGATTALGGILGGLGGGGGAAGASDAELSGADVGMGPNGYGF